jgi:hypothetical protein
VPKKKKSHGHPAQRGSSGGQLSPLRAGGRALGDLQVPFRRFLEAELAEDAALAPGEPTVEAPMEVGDLEARLMESLGWLLLSLELDLTPAAARRFHPEELQELFTEIVPAVAEHNELDAQELVDETRVAWTSYLMFLGETEEWAGEPEELADCLDVASGGVAGAAAGRSTVLDALEAAELAVPTATRLEDLSSLPVVAAELAALGELALGVEAGEPGVDTGPAIDVLTRHLAPFEPALSPLDEWVDLVTNGVVVVEDGRTTVPRLDDVDHRCDVATTILASAVSGTLAAAESPGAIVGALSVVTASVLDPMTAGRLRELLTETGDEEDFAATSALVARLVELGVLSPVEPWTARPGLAGAVLDVVDGFFGEDEGQDDEDVAPESGRA